MRLIDADKLISEIKSSAFPQDSFYPRHYKIMIQELAEVPTVDAVPVIRCKDCKRRDLGTRTYEWCSRTDCYVMEDDFCSRAERRKDEAD